MGIKAQKSRYHGDKGWDSDPQLFAEVAVTWKRWLGQAGDHLCTAEILLPHVEQWFLEVKRLMETKKPFQVQVAPALTNIYFLHCAFALENTFKGVIAQKFEGDIRREMATTHKMPGKLIGHDLVDLAKRAGFGVGIDEEYTLAFLSRYGIWAGRYPIPIKNENYGATNKLSDGNHYVTAGGFDPYRVNAFVAFCGTVQSWARAQVEKR